MHLIHPSSSDNFADFHLTSDQGVIQVMWAMQGVNYVRFFDYRVPAS